MREYTPQSFQLGYKRSRKYKYNYSDDLFLYSMAEGDLSRCEQIEGQTRERAYNFLYIKRVQKLNEALCFIARCEKQES